MSADAQHADRDRGRGDEQDDVVEEDTNADMPEYGLTSDDIAYLKVLLADRKLRGERAQNGRQRSNPTTTMPGTR